MSKNLSGSFSLVSQCKTLAAALLSGAGSRLPAIDRRDRRTDGRTDSSPTHRRLPQEASSVSSCCRLERFTLRTDTHPFNGPFSGTTQVSRYQKGKTNLDFTEARDSEWQWHQLEHLQVCTSLQTDNHANTPPLSFLQAGCPSCRPTNSVKALKAPLVALTGSKSK